VLMFLHIGRDMIVCFDDIIGIFDIETANTSKITREYLSASPCKEIISVTEELPKSFIVCNDGLNVKNKDKNKTRIYISQISSSTLKKRMEAAKLTDENLYSGENPPLEENIQPDEL
jgi:extracellular matrix regulatory protein B